MIQTRYGHLKAQHRLTGPERRTRILFAAAEAFASKGYRATSVSEICKAAGITKPVFYDHFDSKRAVFGEVMDSARDELTSHASDMMRRDAPLHHRVRDTIDSFFAFVEEKPAFARVLLFGAKGEPELATIDWEVQQEATARLAALMRGDVKPHMVASGHDHDLHLQAEFLKQGMHGLAEWWYHNPTMRREVLVDVVMDLVWPELKAHFPADDRAN
jgi:AcrR family transcriptional regulator